MPNKKISELTSAGALTGTEQIPLARAGQTLRTTAQAIADLAAASGATFEEVTFAETQDLVADSELIPGNMYSITDLGILVTAITNNTFSPTAIRIMLCPFQYAIGVTDGNSWKGVWHPTLTDADVEVDDLMIYGGLVWKNLTGNIGTAPDNFTMDNTNWVLIPKASFSNGEYTALTFEITYNFLTNWIQMQTDGLGNRAGFAIDIGGGDPNPVDVTDWNSPLSGGILYITNTCLFGFYNNRGTTTTNYSNNNAAFMRGNKLKPDSLLTGCRVFNQIEGNTCGSIYNVNAPSIIQNANDGTLGNIYSYTSISGIPATYSGMPVNNISGMSFGNISVELNFANNPLAAGQSRIVGFFLDTGNSIVTDLHILGTNLVSSNDPSTDSIEVQIVSMSVSDTVSNLNNGVTSNVTPRRILPNNPIVVTAMGGDITDGWVHITMRALNCAQLD